MFELLPEGQHSWSCKCHSNGAAAAWEALWASAACSGETWAFCRCLQLEPSPCCCPSCSRKNSSAVWVVAGLGAVAVVAAAAAAVAEVEAAAVWDSAVPAGNTRGRMWRCSQLNHNWSRWCLRVGAEGGEWRQRVSEGKKSVKRFGSTWTASSNQSNKLHFKIPASKTQS